jgi:8-oxo-dGTP diphosphatase
MSAAQARASCDSQRPGPALLVQTYIFADEHMLLMKRGTPPYSGSWAAPGGFVEPHESVEAAAIRETWEEVRIPLRAQQLIPLAAVSIPQINQFYLVLLARLERIVPPEPIPPEALDARWFPEHAFPLSDIWQPAANFDMTALFERARHSRLSFYQNTEQFLRHIHEDERMVYIRGAG